MTGPKGVRLPATLGQIVTGISMALLTLMMAVIGYFMRDEMSSRHEESQYARTAITTMGHDLASIKTTLNKMATADYPTRHEWTALERRIETLERNK